MEGSDTQLILNKANFNWLIPSVHRWSTSIDQYSIVILSIDYITISKEA